MRTQTQLIHMQSATLSCKEKINGNSAKDLYTDAKMTYHAPDYLIK